MTRCRKRRPRGRCRHRPSTRRCANSRRPSHATSRMRSSSGSEEGDRLNIRKATLAEWRKAFARHLRDHGVASKATQRSTRGKARMSKLKGIYRPVRTPPLKRSGHSISRERTSKGTSSKRPQIVVSVQPCKLRDEQRQAGKGLLRYPSTLRGRVHVDAEVHRG